MIVAYSKIISNGIFCIILKIIYTYILIRCESRQETDLKWYTYYTYTYYILSSNNGFWKFYQRSPLMYFDVFVVIWTRDGRRIEMRRRTLFRKRSPVDWWSSPQQCVDNVNLLFPAILLILYGTVFKTFFF